MSCCDQTILDAIDNFYKLKSKYELKIKKDKEKIYNNDLLTKKEKKIEYSKIKRKCVKCGKEGGTIFQIKNINNKRTFKAICNSIETKCKLDIEIILGTYETRDNILSILGDYIDNIKTEITKIKLDILFDYISEEKAIELFNENKKELDESTEMFRKILTDFLVITDNYIKNQNIKKNNLDLYENIQSIKNHVKLFNETNNIDHLKESIQIYQSRIIPISNRNQNMKYSNVDIEEHPKNDNIFILKQDEYTIYDLEMNIGNNNANIIKNNY